MRCALALFLFLLVWTPLDLPAQEVSPARLSFVVVGSQVSRELIDGAIDDATKDLSFLRRGFVRSRLREDIPVPNVVHLEIDAQRLSVALEGEGMVVAPKDGTLVHRRSGEEIVTYRHGIDGRALVHASHSPGFRREIRFEFDGSVQVMYMHVRIWAEGLDEPISFRLTYASV